MSSKLRLNSEQAFQAFNAIEEALQKDLLSVADIIENSEYIVSLWAAADLDLLDDEILPFRTFEKDLLVYNDKNSIDRDIKNYTAVYARSKNKMLQFIRKTRETRDSYFRS